MISRSFGWLQKFRLLYQIICSTIPYTIMCNSFQIRCRKLFQVTIIQTFISDVNAIKNNHFALYPVSMDHCIDEILKKHCRHLWSFFKKEFYWVCVKYYWDSNGDHTYAKLEWWPLTHNIHIGVRIHIQKLRATTTLIGSWGKVSLYDWLALYRFFFFLTRWNDSDPCYVRFINHK